jgi:hypothetical protein
MSLDRTLGGFPVAPGPTAAFLLKAILLLAAALWATGEALTAREAVCESQPRQLASKGCR